MQIVTIERGFAPLHAVYDSPHINWQPDEDLIDKARDIVNDTSHQGHTFYNWWARAIQPSKMDKHSSSLLLLLSCITVITVMVYLDNCVATETYDVLFLVST